MAAEWRATMALDDLRVKSVHCRDTAAKQVELAWHSTPTPDQQAEAAKRIVELGLHFMQ